MQYLEIGQIVNTFGIKGMVKVVPYTDDIERFDDLKKVYVVNKKTRKEYEIQEVKYHKNMVLIKFKGIEKVEEAQNLRNSYLEIDRKEKYGYPFYRRFRDEVILLKEKQRKEDERLENEIKAIKNSITFRVGKYLLYIPRCIKLALWSRKKS